MVIKVEDLRPLYIISREYHAQRLVVLISTHRVLMNGGR